MRVSQLLLACLVQVVLLAVVHGQGYGAPDDNPSPPQGGDYSGQQAPEPAYPAPVPAGTSAPQPPPPPPQYTPKPQPYNPPPPPTSYSDEDKSEEYGQKPSSSYEQTPDTSGDSGKPVYKRQVDNAKDDLINATTETPTTKVSSGGSRLRRAIPHLELLRHRRQASTTTKAIDPQKPTPPPTTTTTTTISTTTTTTTIPTTTTTTTIPTTTMARSIINKRQVPTSAPEVATNSSEESTATSSPPIGGGPFPRQTRQAPRLSEDENNSTETPKVTTIVPKNRSLFARQAPTELPASETNVSDTSAATVESTEKVTLKSSLSGSRILRRQVRQIVGGLSPNISDSTATTTSSSSTKDDTIVTSSPTIVGSRSRRQVPEISSTKASTDDDVITTGSTKTVGIRGRRQVIKEAAATTATESSQSTNETTTKAL